MITPQQFLDAVADFESLIGEGWQSQKAIAEAATSNGIDPDVFSKRLSREIDLESRVEAIRRKVGHDRFLMIAAIEVAKCKKREGAYKTLGLLGSGAEDHIIQSVGTLLSRPLTQHETWIIEEYWNPLLFEAKRASRSRIALRKQRSGAD